MARLANLEMSPYFWGNPLLDGLNATGITNHITFYSTDFELPTANAVFSAISTNLTFAPIETMEEIFRQYQESTSPCPAIYFATGIPFEYSDYYSGGTGPFVGEEIAIITTDDKFSCNFITSPSSNYQTSIVTGHTKNMDTGEQRYLPDYAPNPDFRSYFIIDGMGWSWETWVGLYTWRTKVPHLAFLSGAMQTLTSIYMDRFGGWTCDLQNTGSIKEFRVPLTATNLTSIIIKNEDLSVTSVNQILINADLNGKFGGYIDLSDTDLYAKFMCKSCICGYIPHNASPTGNGCISVRNLISKNWIVKTN